MTGDINLGEQAPQDQNQIDNNASQQRRVVSITEAASLNNVTRQAIYVAIKQRKLRATKDATRWTIDLDDLEEYKKNKGNGKGKVVEMEREIEME